MTPRKLKHLKTIGRSRNSFKRTVRNYFSPWSLTLILVLICRCESKERFYRPDLPEKLCCIGIIDVDDTTLRHISFEKSFQSEYPEELNDSLRDFSFSISSSGGELFNYQCNSTVKHIKDLRIPDDILFIPGEKYYLKANEKDAKEMTAGTIATALPSIPEIISVDKVKSRLAVPVGCIGDDTAKSVIITFSFEKNQNLYYAILVKGWGYSFSSTITPWPGFMDFSVIEANTPVFIAEIQGLKTWHYVCSDPFTGAERFPAYAWFIEGKKIPEAGCRVTLAVRFADGYNLIEIMKAVSIKILSIPEDLYLFEKSLSIYKKTSGDPFAEPVYLGGNIKGGEGIFALCRSRELKITFPHFY